MSTLSSPVRSDTPLMLRGAHICDGSGPPYPADLVIAAGRIAEVRPPSDELPSMPSARVLDLHGHLVTPGLFDVHTHLFSSGDPNLYERELLHESLSLRTLRGAAHARAMLDNGFTTVRDVCTEGASYADVALRDAIAAGLCEGPRVVPCGPGIGVTGGYIPMGIAPGVCLPMGCSICDGVEAARREVRAQIAHGAAWIKVFADWPCRSPISQEYRDLPTFAPSELSAIVEEAARRGRKVAAHATSDAGARQAVLAGVASLEHMGTLSRETLDLCAERGVFIVPTLSVLEERVTGAANERDRDSGQRRLDVAAEAFGRLLSSGARVASGSDIGAYPHAKGSLSELRLMMMFGMSAQQVLRAATFDAAVLLGLDNVGVLAPGAAADLCVFRANSDPVDLGAALTSGRPALVILGGRLVGGPA